MISCCVRKHRLSYLLLRAVACTAVFVVGCSKQNGPTRYAVSGTVTFLGKPLPRGRIAFEPDTQQGNGGPAGYADIVDGRFHTHLGAIGGPHVVRISGASGPVVDESKDTTLFTNYTATCELPRQAAKLDFDVPSAAGQPRR